MIEHQWDLLRVTLNYKSIHGLFRMPDVSPFSEDYQVYSAASGIEFIVNEMRANSSLKRVEATIVLPADQITPDLEVQICEAVRRFCRARIHAVRQDQRILCMNCLRIMCAEGLSCNFKWHYHVWK